MVKMMTRPARVRWQHENVFPDLLHHPGHQSALHRPALFPAPPLRRRPAGPSSICIPRSSRFFTTIYAFFLGFAIVTLWSAFLTAQANVTREADSLLIAYRLSKTLPNSEAFRRSLADYVKSVVEDEWPAMAATDAMSEKTQNFLEKLWDNFILLKPADKSDNDLYLEIGNRLSVANQQRLSRALLTQGNLYPPVWVIIIFGFLTVLYGLFFNHIQQKHGAPRLRFHGDLCGPFLHLLHLRHRYPLFRLRGGQIRRLQINPRQNAGLTVTEP